MRYDRTSQGFFLLGLAALTLSFIPACGGGSSSAGIQAAPAQVVHESTVSGPHAIAIGTSVTVRTVTFTPSDPTDVLLYAVVDSTYGFAGPAMNLVCYLVGGTTHYVTRTLPLGRSVPGFVYLEAGFKAATYVVRVDVEMGGPTYGEVTTLQIRFVTAKGATILSPSPQLGG